VLLLILPVVQEVFNLFAGVIVLSQRVIVFAKQITLQIDIFLVSQLVQRLKMLSIR
jgi:hypothetical protein